MRILVASDLHGSMPALRFLWQKAHDLAPDLLVPPQSPAAGL